MRPNFCGQNEHRMVDVNDHPRAISESRSPDGKGTRMDQSTSRELLTRARTLIPGGVNSPVRAFGGARVAPPFIKKGKGAFLYDEDGRRYVDYVGSWGPLILGHAHPRVVEENDGPIDARGDDRIFNRQDRHEVAAVAVLDVEEANVGRARREARRRRGRTFLHDERRVEVNPAVIGASGRAVEEEVPGTVAAVIEIDGVEAADRRAHRLDQGTTFAQWSLAEGSNGFAAEANEKLRQARDHYLRMAAGPLRAQALELLQRYGEGWPESKRE